MSITDILKAAGIVAITSISQITGVIDSTSQGKPAIVNVYSEFCGYSHQMARKYANHVTLASNIGFYGANANMIEKLNGDYKIAGLPAFIGFACGHEFGRVIGADDDGLSQLLTKLGDVKC